MSFLGDAKMYACFVWGLRGFLKRTLTLEEAKATILKRMEEREANFLRLVRKGIFGYPKSPYLPLMKLAQCEMGDIENMVHNKGLEKTLLALRENGVYVTFEEFKGKEPMTRSGHVIPVQSHDFDNPFLSHYYQAETGGTTGAGTRVDIDLDHQAAQTANIMLAYDMHGVLNVPTALWYGVLPVSSGIENILRGALFSNIPRRWFSPITNQDFKPALKNRIANHYIISMGRLLGLPMPSPEPLPLERAIEIARWAAQTLKTTGPCLIRTSVSRAVRICLAAREERLDLKGVTLMGGSEPSTPSKVREITSSGANWVPNYFFVEAGAIGWGCKNPVDTNDLHFFKDILALIQYPRQVPGSEVTVDAFHFTSLLPTAFKLMLNVESDDYGIIEKRSCGCLMENYGFTDHLRHVRSFRKLTGEGVTLVGSEMVRLLEEILPTKFGGSPLDYQLLEEEDEHGFTRLSLVVSPRIEIKDEEKVIEVVLEGLRRGSVSANLARAIWGQAKTLRVKRIEPIWTSHGKLMSFYRERRSNPLYGPSRDIPPNE